MKGSISRAARAGLGALFKNLALWPDWRIRPAGVAVTASMERYRGRPTAASGGPTPGGDAVDACPLTPTENEAIDPYGG